MTDEKLLREYLDAGSEEAFAELVRRHADWIYSAALRMVRDRHLAEDVTQAVFMVLAKDGRKVGNKPVNAWLFGVMRYSAIHALRSRERQQRRERRAAEMAMQNTDSRQGETWEELAGRLEDSVWRLGGQDRRAVLLRFYEQKSLAEVGAALGVSEDAARKRVGRAVRQLRKMLGRTEITASAELSEMLVRRVTHPAPGGVKASCVSAKSAVAGGAAVIAKGTMTMMLATKLKIAAAGLIALALIPTAVGVVMVTRKAPVTGAAASRPAAVSSVVMAQRIEAAGNLREIGQRLLLYANENIGSYPPTLGDLVRTEGMFPGERIKRGTWLPIFLVPGDPRRPPRSMNRNQQADWVTAHSDYTYLGAALNEDNDIDYSTIIASQKVTVKGDDELNLLFGGGDVYAFPPAVADQLLKENAQAHTAAAPLPATANQQIIERWSCAGCLRHIGQVIQLYRYTHAGNYPPDFHALQADEHLDATFFACPAADNARIADFRKMEPAPAKLPAWIFNQDDFIYAANKPQPGATDAMRIIAYDKDKNHGDGANILFGDGHVRWYSLLQARKIIEEQ